MQFLLLEHKSSSSSCLLLVLLSHLRCFVKKAVVASGVSLLQSNITVCLLK